MTTGVFGAFHFQINEWYVCSSGVSLTGLYGEVSQHRRLFRGGVGGASMSFASYL